MLQHRLRVALPIAIWLSLFLTPTPSGLTDAAWSYFALFAAVIAGLIVEPLPAAAIGLLGLTIATVAGYVGATPSESVKWGLSGFSNTTVWLIFGAFMLSMGYQKTGLGRRLALVLVKAMGHHTLGLGYAITFSDLLLAPGTPSNTARSAGTIYPIIAHIPPLFEHEGEAAARQTGAYLMWTAFAATAVTSALFLTALAPNPLAVSMARETAGVEITWTNWLLGSLPVCGPLLLLLPAIVFVLCPPGVKRSPGISSWAASELRELGPIKRRERVMAGLVIAALALWIFGSGIVAAATVVLITISLMVILGVVGWDDVLGNRGAWNVLVWFATLVALAGGLNQVGFVDWAAHRIVVQFEGLPPRVILVALVGFFYLSHYFFASLTAHTMALFPVVLAVGNSVPGMPVDVLALLLGYSLGLMGVITPYATGPAPVYYSCGYIAPARFWKLGFLFGMLFLLALLAIGVPWLSYIF